MDILIDKKQAGVEEQLDELLHSRIKLLMGITKIVAGINNAYNKGLDEQLSSPKTNSPVITPVPELSMELTS